MAGKLSKVTTLDRAAVAARFDYDVIAVERRDALQEDARQIRFRLIETAGAMMDIGERLVRSRSVLPHGTWLPWLAAETGMSVQWARNCINLYLRFADKPLLLSDLDLALPPTAIVRLVAAPEAAWEDIVDRVREGEKMRVADVEDVIKDHRDREKAAERKTPRARSSAAAGALPAVDALRRLADRARDELVPRTVERMQAMLQVLEAAEERLTTGPKVTAIELQKLRENAQWLTDALEQLTQRRTDSMTHLVHKTFLDRPAYEPGPWAEAAAFIADIASSEDCAATIRKAGPADFVRRGVTVLRGVLSSSPEPAPPKLPTGLRSVEDALRMDCIVCLEDGRKVENLAAHLATLGISPQDYRRKWSLPAEYPMQSPRQIMRHGATFEVDYETGAMHLLTIEANAPE